MNFSVIYILHYETESKTLSLVMKIFESNYFILHTEVEIRSKYIRKQRNSKKTHSYIFENENGIFPIAGKL